MTAERPNAHRDKTRILRSLGRLSVSSCLLLAILLLTAPLVAFSAEPPLAYETKYSTIRYSEEKTLSRFTKSIGSGISFFSGVNLEKNPLLPRDRVDKLVERVISILDMHPKNLRFNIFVYETYDELGEAYSEIK